MREFQAADFGALELSEAHQRICDLAERRLPRNPFLPEDRDGAAQ